MRSWQTRVPRVSSQPHTGGPAFKAPLLRRGRRWRCLGSPGPTQSTDACAHPVPGLSSVPGLCSFPTESAHPSGLTPRRSVAKETAQKSCLREQSSSRAGLGQTCQQQRGRRRRDWWPRVWECPSEKDRARAGCGAGGPQPPGRACRPACHTAGLSRAGGKPVACLGSELFKMPREVL